MKKSHRDRVPFLRKPRNERRGYGGGEYCGTTDLVIGAAQAIERDFVPPEEWDWKKSAEAGFGVCFACGERGFDETTIERHKLKQCSARTFVEVVKAVLDEPVTGKVYFISDGEFVKIGYTSGSISKRLAALQTGCPRELSVLGWVPGSLSTERLFHCMLDDHRSRAGGEWFRMGDHVAPILTHLRPLDKDDAVCDNSL